MAKLGDGFGLAEGGSAMCAATAVLSGKDFRRGGDPYINQLMMVVNGGPAGPKADGWVTYVLPVVSGLMYRDSIELAEVKHPMLFRTVRLMAGTGGAGRHRGGPACEVVYGPREDSMTVVIPSDCQINPARGAQGGHDGTPAVQFKVGANGDQTKLPNVVQLDLLPGRADPRPRCRRRRVRRPHGARPRTGAHGRRPRLGKRRSAPARFTESCSPATVRRTRWQSTVRATEEARAAAS